MGVCCPFLGLWVGVGLTELVPSSAVAVWSVARCECEFVKTTEAGYFLEECCIYWDMYYLQDSVVMVFYKVAHFSPIRGHCLDGVWRLSIHFLYLWSAGCRG